MKAKLNNFVVLDCETGGLDRKNQEHARLVPMTEIAMIGVSADNFHEFGRYVSKIKGQEIDGEYVGYDPSLVYQPEALKFTGTTISMIERDGKTLKEVVANMIEIFKITKTGSHFHKPIIVGHNVTYDIPFIQHAFDLMGEDLSKYVSGWKDQNRTFQPHFIDTMWMSRQKWAEEGMKHTLSDLCGRLGVDLFDAHGALSDTVATLECFKKMTIGIRTGEMHIGEINQGVERTRDTFEI